ncbi:MAG: radical SAM protein [Candidatus Helarchaeota archaeon]|nr:radical SAM protein [Candidatus Helarchaeota archaeon]
MTKVLLLNPPSKLMLYKEDLRCQNDADDLIHNIIRPPITLMYLAAISEQLGFQTKLIDAPVEGIELNQLKKILEFWKPDWVAANTSIQTLESDLAVLKIAKENNVKTITFGYAPTINGIEILKNTNYIDFLIRGEPEKPFQEIIQGTLPLKDIEGLTYRENDEIQQNKERNFLQNLDELPFPSHHLIRHDLYRVPTTGEIFTTIQTSKGCPNHCTFCLSNILNGRKVRKRNIANIIEEIKLVTTNLHIKNFFFRADTFTFDKQWILQLCQAIIKNNLRIRWFCNSRVDTIDSEMLSAMKKAGCYYICFGVESGNSEILKYIRKGITKAQSKQAIQLAKNFGIVTAAVYIIGLPGDTLNSIHETIQFSKEVDSDLAEFIPYIQFPGIEALHQTLPKVQPSLVRKLRKYAFIQFYFRPKILLKLIHRFYLKNQGLSQLFNLILVSVKTVSRIFKK